MKDKINTIFRLRDKIGTIHVKPGAIRYALCLPLPELCDECRVECEGRMASQGK